MKTFITVIFIIISSFLTYGQSKWNITKTGLGIIQLGMPLAELKTKLEVKFKLQMNSKGGFDIFNENDLIISVWQKDNDGKVGFIKITSEKYETLDGIHVGQKIDEVANIRNDFFLEMDEITGHGYFAPQELQVKDSEFWKSLNLIYFKSLNDKELADYKYDQNTESFRATEFNNESIVDYILIYKWN